MKSSLRLIAVVIALLPGITGVQWARTRPSKDSGGDNGLFREETDIRKNIQKTDKEWKDILSPDEYRVLRKAGTERPFSGKYDDHYKEGVYACGACGTPLFASEKKYDHGTGWPSFKAPTQGN